MKYLIITTRHKSPAGEKYCMFWGNKESAEGYTPDVRLAHRFSEDELPRAQLKNMGDFAIPCYGLGVPEEYVQANPYTCEIVELVTAMGMLRDLD